MCFDMKNKTSVNIVQLEICDHLKLYSFLWKHIISTSV